MSDDLLQAFATKKTPNDGQTIPVFVKGYILPPPGTPENENNARVLGVRWDTQERIEIALRELETGNRPLIAQFQDDSNSSTPVTTEIGGTIMVEAAYLDSKLTPLSGKDVSVYSGRWLNRVSPKKDQGWALRSLARVNAPRLMDANNPAAGKTQTITIMSADKTQQVSSLEELDTCVLNALDSQMRDSDPQWFNRPGAVNVFVRLSAGTESNLIELSGGFYQPSDSPYPAPNTRAMVQDNLGKNDFWKQKRDLLSKALTNPAYKVEVVPGSTIFVGRKTLQKSLQTEYGPIRGVSRELDGAQTAMFTDSVIGIRRSQKSGLPQALFVSPFKRNQVASMTGMPNQAESALYGNTSAPVTSQAANQNATPTVQNAAPQVQTPVINQTSPEQPIIQANAQPVAPQSSSQQAAPMFVRQHLTDPTKFLVSGTTDAHIATLKHLSEEINAPYDEKHKGIYINNLQLPHVMQRAKRDSHQVKVVDSQVKQAPMQAAPQTAAQPAAIVDTPSAAPQEALIPFEEQSQDAVDLSQLDLSNLDLDNVLVQAYQSSSAQNNRR